MPVKGLYMGTRIDDCTKDGAEECFTKVPCCNEEISQSNQSKFNAMQRIMVKNCNQDL